MDHLNHENKGQDADKNPRIQIQEVKRKITIIEVTYDASALAEQNQQQSNQNSNKIHILNQDKNNEQQLTSEVESLKKIMTKQCDHCKILQDSDFIILPCSHTFHAECFKSMLETQVNQQQSILQCICTKKIPQNIIMKYLNQFQLSIYYQIQVQTLPQKNPEPQQSKDKQVQRKWKKCTNLGCDYIYIEVLPDDGVGVMKCPNCIERICGKTMIFSN